jgi:predicted DNA-binding protein
MQKRTTHPTDMRLSLSVPLAVWERLKGLSTREKRSMNDLLNEWINERLERLDREQAAG